MLYLLIYRYDEDVFVESMTAGFVMWEDNGRHDFTYTASMQSVTILCTVFHD